MKKISLKNLSNDEILTKDELRKIVGGNGSGGTNDPCFTTYFYEGSDGCGYVKCMGKNEVGDCECDVIIDTPQPCGFA